MTDTIALMRKRVLDMAIRGELVKQREEEGTAEEIYQYIHSIKEALIKSGKVKKEKKLPEIEAEVVPFDIPKSWKWVRLGEVSTLLNGDRGKNYPGKAHWTDEGIPFINAGTLNNKYLDSRNMNFIPEERFKLLRSGFVEKNDIIYCLRGSLGKLSINKKFERGAIASSVVIIRANENIDVEYLYYLLVSNYAEKLIQKVNTGTAQPNISARNVSEYEIPLPPVQEQKRIVAKIEEIFAVIDQIDTRKEEALTIIQNMRQITLQDALMGLLVEQDVSDEPASELFKKINFEKDQMIVSGNVKKPKPLKISAENDNDYDIPLNWKWIKLDDIAVINRGASPRPIKEFITEDEDGINWIKIGDSVRGKKYIDSVNQKITKDGAEKSVYASKGDLIMTNSMSFGYAYIMNTDGCIHDGWLSFKLPKNLVDVNWMYYILNANYKNFEKLAVGTGVRNLNIDRVRSVYIGLPPLAEQGRIVSKLDEIMEICDQMEAIFDGTTETNNALKVAE